MCLASHHVTGRCHNCLSSSLHRGPSSKRMSVWRSQSNHLFQIEELKDWIFSPPCLAEQNLSKFLLVFFSSQMETLVDNVYCKGVFSKLTLRHLVVLWVSFLLILSRLQATAAPTLILTEIPNDWMTRRFWQRFFFLKVAKAKAHVRVLSFDTTSPQLTSFTWPSIRHPPCRR